MKQFNVDQDKNYKSLENLLSFQTKDKNLYIFGKPGVGKTTFLKEFGQKFSQDKIKIQGFLIPKYKVAYINSNNWIKDIQKSWTKEFESPTKVNTSADILLIDDLGSEYFHKSTLPYILELFESRYEYTQKNKDKVITIITSNYSVEQLRDKYFKAINDDTAVERLFSRIEGILDLSIQFIGKDKRKENIDIDFSR